MIDNLPQLPLQKRALLDHLVGQLRQVPGMAAIVLGGSYATGTQHAASDLDIGLYYAEAWPFAIADIRRIAEEVAVQRPVTVTDFYGRTLEEIRAPFAGEVLYVIGTPPMTKGEPVGFVAAPATPADFPKK